MKKFVLMGLVLAAGTAVAQEVTPAPILSEAEGEMLVGAAQAFAQGAWYVMLGFVLMLLTHFVRTKNWLSKVPKEYLPWVTVIFAALASIGESLITGAPLAQAVANTGALGTTAVFLWEGIFKHVKTFQAVKEKTEEKAA